MGFDLLGDFWEAAGELSVRDVAPQDLDREAIDFHVRAPMTTALVAAEGAPVEVYDVDWLRTNTAAAIGRDEFCVTLDHGVYFDGADFELDFTRVASDIRHTGSQHFRRRPRSKANPLAQQIKRLGKDWARSGKERVVLADDGLTTGETLKIVIGHLREHGVPVSRVVVCCNNRNIEIAQGIEVHSIVSRHGWPWLNERDLYWGLPRSGLPLPPENGAERTYSIPFSVNDALVTQRIGVEDGVSTFRAACLMANKTLWEMFESSAGRTLVCEDCPSLQFIADLLARPNTRVVDLLEGLASGDDHLDLEAARVAVKH